MDNLHRELAPVSAAAWAQIGQEATRTFKRHLAGRRVVDVDGPDGYALSAVGTGRARDVDAPADGVLARQRLAVSLVELRAPLHVVDLLAAQAERDTQFHHCRGQALPGVHPVGGRVDGAHPAGAHGRELIAVRAVHVHDPPGRQVPLERAGGLFPDLGPGGIGDGRELAVQVIHRRVPLSGCRYSAIPPAPAGQAVWPGWPLPPRQPLRPGRRPGLQAMAPTARKTGSPSPPG